MLSKKRGDDLALSTSRGVVASLGVVLALSKSRIVTDLGVMVRGVDWTDGTSSLGDGAMSRGVAVSLGVDWKLSTPRGVAVSLGVDWTLSMTRGVVLSLGVDWALSIS